MILDHVGFNVSDLAATKTFLTAALAPLGIAVVKEDRHSAMYGRDGRPQFWVGDYGPSPGPIHLAFVARSRAEVDAFHVAALAAGGKDNGSPGLRPEYHPGYYGAFVIGPDGHNFEAVVHGGP